MSSRKGFNPIAEATAAEIAGAAAGAAWREGQKKVTEEREKKLSLANGIFVNNSNNNNNNGTAKKKARGGEANNWGGADIFPGLGEEAGIGTGVEEEGGAAAAGAGGGSSYKGHGPSISEAAEGARWNYRSSSLEPPPYRTFSEVMASLPPAAAPLNKPNNKRKPVTNRKRKLNNGKRNANNNNTRKGAGGAAAAAPKPKPMRKRIVGNAAAAGAGGGNNGRAAAAAGAGGGAAPAVPPMPWRIATGENPLPRHTLFHYPLLMAVSARNIDEINKIAAAEQKKRSKDQETYDLLHQSMTLFHIPHVEADTDLLNTVKNVFRAAGKKLGLAQATLNGI